MLFVVKSGKNPGVKRARKRKDWEPKWHEGAKKWRVVVPGKLSPTNRRQDRYFDSQEKAEKFIAATLKERQEHGRQAVSAEERTWINFARQQLGGDLSVLATVISHWKKTGAESITKISVRDAVQEFIASRDRVGRRTISDIRYRLNAFAGRFGDTPLHQVTAGEIEKWIKQQGSDWSRKGFYKRIRPLFAYGLRHRWLSVNPIDMLETVEVRKVKKEFYTADEFQELLLNAVATAPNLLPLVALKGFAMMRTSELLRLYQNEDVLAWEDIEWDENRIHVREEVGKSTRRAGGNERWIPIIPALRDWLYQFRQESGLVCPMLHHDIAEPWRLLHGKTVTDGKVWYKLREPIVNGLRRSAISHRLAAEPELGIVQCARWAGNSEATIKGSYLTEAITPAEGRKWFTTATEQLAEINKPLPVID